jgi:secreted trypsin-like serine protease
MTYYIIQIILFQGDSGGPLITTIGLNQIQIGIVSFVSGSGCDKGIPSGYLRVTPYLNWLRAVTRIVY